ncbi:MAG: iron-sulfur cluster assembly accessory protein [Alphaproteobacteria bacterium]|nr:iron-sulfur cluster assembly accessory protein [Alphaproteobacteria bacterium]
MMLKPRQIAPSADGGLPSDDFGFALKKDDSDVPEGFTLSENAIAQLEEVLAQHPQSLFRVSVHPGGCAGFQYEFTLTTESADPADHLMLNDRIVTDNRSWSLLRGGCLDFVSEIRGKHFFFSFTGKKRLVCDCKKSFSFG